MKLQSESNCCFGIVALEKVGLNSQAMSTVLVILGPTASGKSALAMRLAQEFGGEIVNADALQVYRKLNIGTAKPSAEDRRLVRHHLVDILDPEESFSAGEFARRARSAISEIGERGHRALVAGGSGLYLRALLEGLSPIPPIPDETRRALQLRASREGLESLRSELRRVDPSTERRLAPGDTQRVLRGLEVWLATGRTQSSWLLEDSGSEPLESIKIGLTLARGLLYDRIAKRVQAMVEQGWVDEVRNLMAGGLTGSEPGFQAIGYRQIVEHLREGMPLPDVIADIVNSTRRYAKRQSTWFRREADVVWYSAADEAALSRTVIADLGVPLTGGGEP